MHQARAVACAEARAEAEAAAEQRIAAALATQRVELVKQARSLLCMCGDRDVRCTALACFCALCAHQTANEAAGTGHARGSVGNDDGVELQCREMPVLLTMPC